MLSGWCPTLELAIDGSLVFSHIFGGAGGLSLVVNSNLTALRQARSAGSLLLRTTTNKYAVLGQPAHIVHVGP